MLKNRMDYKYREIYHEFCSVQRTGDDIIDVFPCTPDYGYPMIEDAVVIKLGEGGIIIYQSKNHANSEKATPPGHFIF